MNLLDLMNDKISAIMPADTSKTKIFIGLAITAGALSFLTSGIAGVVFGVTAICAFAISAYYDGKSSKAPETYQVDNEQTRFWNSNSKKATIASGLTLIAAIATSLFTLGIAGAVASAVGLGLYAYYKGREVKNTELLNKPHSKSEDDEEMNNIDSKDDSNGGLRI